MLIMHTITYWDLIMWELDQKYVDRLINEYDVDCSELDITYVFTFHKFNSTIFTNAVISEIMYWIVMHNVTDIDDQNKLLDSIFTNCFDSHYNIDPDELNSEEAKDLVINFW